MLPKAKDADTLLFQFCIDNTVSIPISPNLSAPEANILSRNMTTLGASMPKATIYKNGNIPRRKEEIWFPHKAPWLHLPSDDSASH
jgi:uncharacterized protein YcsI (UPF0317 family)